MPRDTVLTPEGLEELKARIEHLRGERRREVAERIKEAREFGDIAENSEYDDAKNEQAMLEKQISDLEEKLRNARVIDDKDVDTDVVSVGATVHVQGPEDREVDEVQDRRLRRGEPRRDRALERVAGRARAARPQARRDRHRAGPARPGPQAQDHQDRALDQRPRAVDDRRAKLERLREQGIDPFPHEFDGRHADRRGPRRARRPRGRRGDRRRLPDRRPHDRPARSRRRRLPRRGRPLAASSRCTPSATSSARSRSTRSPPSTSAT